MKINQIQNYSPNFSAKFANNETTKKVLRDITNTANDVYDLRDIMTNIELSGIDGEISLKQKGYQIVAHSSITNKNLFLGNPYSTSPLKFLADTARRPQCEEYSMLFGTEKSEIKYADKSISINRAMDQFEDKTKQKKFDRKMKKMNSKINQLENDKVQINKKIYEIEREQHELIKAQHKKEVDYLISLIG